VSHHTDASLAALRRQHSHRQPDRDAVALIENLRQRFADLAVALDVLLPSSREKSLAQTNLDQARMWAMNAATLDGEIKNPVVLRFPE
jgi:hypothetical protein